MAHYGPARSNERAVSELFKRQPRTRAKQEPRNSRKRPKKENNKEVSAALLVVLGAGVEMGMALPEWAGGWGSYLKYLRRRLNSSLGGFFSWLWRALLLSVRIVRHEGKTQKHKKIHI